MTKEAIEKLNYFIENVKMSNELREDLRQAMQEEKYKYVIEKLEKINSQHKNSKSAVNDDNENEEENTLSISNEENIEQNDDEENLEDSYDVIEGIYPELLKDELLEETFLGLLLEDPKLITRYYFLNKECFFENDEFLNIYTSILFTEGSQFASENAKKGFTLPNVTEKTNFYKKQFKQMVENKEYDAEKIYVKLKKLFVLRKSFLEIPIRNIQIQVINIIKYKLYSKMTVEEVESAVQQVTDTEKFKRSILSNGLSEFLKKGENTLTTGLELPFPILSEVFKGIRRGETMAFSMPSNSGKSRFTINLAAYTALIHNKKVLVISNEMSEEKMKLCLITTIINNPEVQKLHGQKLRKTEGELLEFKFRPDKKEKIELDEEGFIKKLENEKQEDFAKRVYELSSEFRMIINVTDWINSKVKNSIHFIHITDHTNDELKKIIMNYYYKEKIEYIFYDTLKTDTENIGKGEEIKKTATILSNLAQNFNLFICSTLQLEENKTLPINLTVVDLAVSKTVKEVLDTLCLVKQIHNDNLDDYEYSHNEVDTKFFKLEKFEDPDVRYYACVVDKNRAGAKPKVLFRLNLAYNEWEELGYLRLKQAKDEKNL